LSQQTQEQFSPGFFESSPREAKDILCIYISFILHVFWDVTLRSVMAQDRVDAIPDAMDCIDKVCLKLLPFLAMLEGVRVDSAVKISAFDDVPDRSQF